MVGTGNAHKTEEIAQVLADLNSIEVTSAKILPESPEIIEDGETFIENARIKALGFAKAASKLAEDSRPHWVLSDDSGLAVDALEGKPGVHSARYSEDIHGPNPSDAQNNAKLLAALSGIEKEQRTARFICTLVLVKVPESPEQAAEILLETAGQCEGRIIESTQGAGGFGYDPLFWVPELGTTFGEAGAELKNQLSHRARALEKLKVGIGSELLK